MIIQTVEDIIKEHQRIIDWYENNPKAEIRVTAKYMLNNMQGNKDTIEVLKYRDSSEIF